ncbi:UNVERIFIED_CONTAM: hypothetical protein HHA_234640 [Hammondia hammondi]|eukprot:XP_008881639.1 hypothetical protein HHA_234640 [Hammondia hammondi]
MFVFFENDIFSGGSVVRRVSPFLFPEILLNAPAPVSSATPVFSSPDMALKKLHTEVEKALREVRACIDAYDERWQELLEFNRQFLEKPDHLDEAKKDVLRGKKHSVRTASLELVDIKHVNDTKARIEADLEGSLRKLHRLKQQLSDWLHNYSDKDIRNKVALVELRKSIELRYKRGRVFYSQGQSSQPGESVGLLAAGSRGGAGCRLAPCEAARWMTDFIDTLHAQIEGWENELTSLSGRGSEDAQPKKCRRRSGREEVDAAKGTPLRQERIDQLAAMLDLHRLHVGCLEGLLHAVCAQELDGDDERLEELREILEPYVHDNADLVVIVADDVYQELGLACSADALRREAASWQGPLARDALTTEETTSRAAALTEAEAQRDKRSTSSSRRSAAPLASSDAGEAPTEAGKREGADGDSSAHPTTQCSTRAGATPIEPPRASFAAAAAAALKLSPSCSSSPAGGRERLPSSRFAPGASCVSALASSAPLREDETRNSHGLRDSVGASSSPDGCDKASQRPDQPNGSISSSSSSFSSSFSSSSSSSSFSSSSSSASSSPSSASSSASSSSGCVRGSGEAGGSSSAKSASRPEAQDPRLVLAPGAAARKGTTGASFEGGFPAESMLRQEALSEEEKEETSLLRNGVPTKPRPSGYAEAVTSSSTSALHAATCSPALARSVSEVQEAGGSGGEAPPRETRTSAGHREASRGSECKPAAWGPAPAGAWALRGAARAAAAEVLGDPGEKEEQFSRESAEVDCERRKPQREETQVASAYRSPATLGCLRGSLGAGRGRADESVNGATECAGAGEAGVGEGARSPGERRETTRDSSSCGPRGKGDWEAREGRTPAADGGVVVALTTETASGWVYGYRVHALQTGEALQCSWYPPETPHVFIPSYREAVDPAALSVLAGDRLAPARSACAAAPQAVDARLSDQDRTSLSFPCAAALRAATDRPTFVRPQAVAVSPRSRVALLRGSGRGDRDSDLTSEAVESKRPLGRGSPHAAAESPFLGCKAESPNSGASSLLAAPLPAFSPTAGGSSQDSVQILWSSCGGSPASAAPAAFPRVSDAAKATPLRGWSPDASPAGFPTAAEGRDAGGTSGDVCSLDAFFANSADVGASGDATFATSPSLATLSPSSPVASSSTHSGGAGSGACCVGSPASSKSSPCGVVTPQSRGGEPGRNSGLPARPASLSQVSDSSHQPSRRGNKGEGGQRLFGDADIWAGVASLLPPGVGEEEGGISPLEATSSLPPLPSGPDAAARPACCGERRAAGPQAAGGTSGFASGGVSDGQPGSAGASTTFSDSARSSRVQSSQPSRDGEKLARCVAAGAATERVEEATGARPGDPEFCPTLLPPHALHANAEERQRSDRGGNRERGEQTGEGRTRHSSGSRDRDAAAVGAGALQRLCQKCLCSVCTVVHILPDEVEVRELHWSWHGELVDEGRDVSPEEEREREVESDEEGTWKRSQREKRNCESELAGRREPEDEEESPGRRRRSVECVRRPGTQGKAAEEEGHGEAASEDVKRGHRCRVESREREEGSGDWRVSSEDGDDTERRSSASRLSSAEPPASGASGVSPRMSRHLPRVRQSPRTCRGCAARLAHSLLCFEKGEFVEVLVHHRQGWIFGRIRGQPHRRGWFPDYMLQRPEDVCSALPLEDLTACAQLLGF